MALTATAAAQPASPGTAEAFGKLVPPGAEVTQLAGDLRFTEGPVWVPEGGLDGGGFLLFSDIPANRLYRWSPSGGLSVFREPSSHTNGNLLTAGCELVSCQHESRTVTRTARDGTVTTLADRFEGKRFNSPNDLAIAPDGAIWFTDPPYGLGKREGELAVNGLYRLDPATGALTRPREDFDRPNGLCFSPDGTRLYVADSGKPRHIRVFDVGPGGTLTGGEVFSTIPVGAPDGIRCDAAGNVWSSTGDGVRVFAPDGTYLGLIPVPQAPANLCFGGPDGKTLFLTARTGLYSIPVNIAGSHPR